MPLDVLGCTRATLMRPTSVSPSLERVGNLLKSHRDGDRLLQFLIFNEEFLVSECESSIYVDYMFALSAHCASLLLIE